MVCFWVIKVYALSVVHSPVRQGPPARDGAGKQQKAVARVWRRQPVRVLFVLFVNLYKSLNYAFTLYNISSIVYLCERDG